MPDLLRIERFLEKVEQSEHTVFAPADARLRVGVDLGTAYIVLVVLDAEANPVACEKQFSEVLRDGVVVDYLGALRTVKTLKERLEARIGRELINAAIAMPPGMDSSIQTHRYVVEGAGMEVVNVLDEPVAANSIYGVVDGAVVDIGGGTTGIAVFKDGKMVKTADEPTGGTHMSLVLAGNYHIPFEQAEAIKTDPLRHKEILPVLKPVIQKMASIVQRHTEGFDIDTLYLCGGTCCLHGLERVFEQETGIKTVKPRNPFLVTPAGIALNCGVPGEG